MLSLYKKEEAVYRVSVGAEEYEFAATERSNQFYNVGRGITPAASYNNSRRPLGRRLLLSVQKIGICFPSNYHY
jgi:hypothetical protein